MKESLMRFLDVGYWRPSRQDERFATYLQGILPVEDFVLRDIREENIREWGDLAQHLHPGACAMLRWIVGLLNPQRVVEIGTYTGYTAAAMALAISDQARIVTCEIDSHFLGRAKYHWEGAGLSKKIRGELVPGIKMLDKLISGGGANQYDLVFIHANPKEYVEYLGRALTLLHKRGVIVVAGTLWPADVTNPESLDPRVKAIADFHEAVKENPQITYAVMPSWGGLIFIQKK